MRERLSDVVELEGIVPVNDKFKKINFTYNGRRYSTIVPIMVNETKAIRRKIKDFDEGMRRYKELENA